MRTAKIGPDVRLLVTWKFYQPSSRALKSCYAANLKRETQRQTSKPVFRTLDSGHHACKYAYIKSDKIRQLTCLPSKCHSSNGQFCDQSRVNHATVTSSSTVRVKFWQATLLWNGHINENGDRDRNTTGINLLTGRGKCHDYYCYAPAFTPTRHVKLKQVLLKTWKTHGTQV